MKINHDVIPKNSLIGKYMSYMSMQETATAYDFWAASWLISVATGRDIYINRPRAPVYLNWYIVLVAESGVTRKSSAVRAAKTIAYKFIEQSAKPILPIEGKTTPEQLESQMAKLSKEYGSSNVAIAISELVTFLGKEKYIMQMPALLTDLYDCPNERVSGGSLSRGTQTMKNVFVSFLSASTPTWLFNGINHDIVEGGFTSRCMFVASERRKQCIAWPNVNTLKEPYEELVPIMLDIEQRAQKQKSITLTEQALTIFTKWYNNQREADDAYNRSFASREDSHILRMAATLAINDGSWYINEHHMVYAINIIAEVKQGGAKIFAGDCHTDKIVKGITKLRDALIKADVDGIKQTLLLFQVRNFLSTKEMNILLEIMKSLHMVQAFTDPSPNAGRKATIWRATTLINAHSSISTLLRELNKLTT